MQRRTTSFVLILFATFAALLSGCGDDAPKSVTPAPVTSVEQMNNEITTRLEEQKQIAEKAAAVEAEKADRLRFVEVLKTPLDQWRGIYASLAGKKTSEVVELSAKMRALRLEMSSTPTTQCTGTARETLFRGMDEVHDVIDAFKNVSGKVPEELALRLGKAEAAVRLGAEELAQCVDAPTVTRQ